MKDSYMDYKFSVIMPLYNVAEYLPDTIDSVVNQTIGFKENIQLILVNDGSPDDVEPICLKYRDAYPDNIVYVYQENAGVSAARNAGMPYIRGMYTNFMDSDDIWGEDAFEKAWNMFEEYGDAIDVVACRMDYFEGKDGYHRLDFRYENGDMLCDIFEHPSYGQFAVCDCFCRSDAIADLSFDTRLSYGEDAKFINQLILKKEKYGLLAGSIYHIRRRNAETSLTQNKMHRRTAYLDTATYYYKYLVDLSKEKYGKVIPYIQYAVMNAIKYRVSSEIPDVIPKDIARQYIDLTLDLIRQTDDEVLCDATNANTGTKVYMLLLKHGMDALSTISYVKRGTLYVGGKKVGKLFRKNSFVISGVKKSLFKTEITGTIMTPVIFKEFALHAFAGSTAYECDVTLDKSDTRMSYRKDPMKRVYNFRVEIPTLKCRDYRKLKWVATTGVYKTTVKPCITSSRP